MSVLQRGKRAKQPTPLLTPSSFSDEVAPSRRRTRVRRTPGYDVDPMSFRAPESLLADEPRPRRGGVLRRLVAVLLLLVAVALIAGLAIAAWLYTSGTEVKPGEKVRVTIPAGADAADIAERLADAGVVSNKTVFQARLRLNGDGAGFRSGSYVLVTGSSYNAIVEKLEAGPPAAPVYNVTVPEGYRVSQVAAKIDELRSEAVAEGAKPLPAFSGEEYLAAVAKTRVPAKYEPPAGTKSMEGFLFPATYELKTTATAEDLVAKQLEAFSSTFDAIDPTAYRKANLTPYEVVNIAAMVEREARVASERPTIAGVIYNRIREGMTLGIDATIQYAVSKVEWKVELTQSDLEIDSPYNTRTNAGLPPTPIANPGKASLEAAANPKKTDAVYYVAKPDGSGEHFFTSSYDEFLNFQNQ